MSEKELRDRIDSLTQDISFEYLGVWGLIFPTTRDKILVTYGEDEFFAHSVDEAMDAPIICGKTLRQLCGEIYFD